MDKNKMKWILHKIKKNRTMVILGCVVAILLAIAVASVIRMLPALRWLHDDLTQTDPNTEPTAETLYTEPTEETTEPVESEPAILPALQEKYTQNPDLAGWITIEGTIVDYPVMYTPSDGDKYLYKNFEKKYSRNGLPFIEDDCSLDPESQNIIIYGHYLNNGKMFTDITKYKKKAYWEEHPTIKFSTLYEEREYEIVAAFYDKVYKKTDKVFKFYQFIDPKDEKAFNEGIAYFKKKAKYDTGITPQYGDKLITLVTCAYHVENGRFVVVAREKTPQS